MKIRQANPTAAGRELLELAQVPKSDGILQALPIKLMFRRRILYLSSFSIPLYTTPAYSCSYIFQTNQRPSTLLKRVHSLAMSNPPVQPADNGMAVVAPNLESNPTTVASHVPQIAVKDGDDSMSENEQPLSKSKANGARKRVDNSSDEEEKPLVSLSQQGFYASSVENQCAMCVKDVIRGPPDL